MEVVFYKLFSRMKIPTYFDILFSSILLDYLLEVVNLKRLGNLYENICDINNIVLSYNEVCRNTHNKRRVENLKEYKSVYISRIHNILENKNYTVGPYNMFTIYEPKKEKYVLCLISIELFINGI